MIELEENQRKLNSLTEKIKTIEEALKLTEAAEATTYF